MAIDDPDRSTKVSAGLDGHASDPYETPRLLEVGDVVTLANGSAHNDTADRKVFYW